MADKQEKIYISQKAIIFDKNRRILSIRRSKTAPHRPMYWDLPGGDVEFGEDLKKDIAREVREETGLEIRDLHIIDAISGYDDKKEFWVTLCYTAKSVSKKIILSYEHDDHRWVNCDEFLKLKTSPRIKKFIEYFKSLQL